MAKKAYKASGKTGDGAVPALFAITLAVGLGAGALEGFVSQWFSLLILFPLVLGAAAGAAGAVVVESRNIRAPALALIAGCIGGFAGQGMVHVVQWRTFVSSVSDRLAEPPEEGEEADPEWQKKPASEKVDEILIEKTGSPGFVGYMKLMAEHGVEIKRTGRTTGTMKEEWFWALTAFEFLLALGAGGAIAFQRAREPYCEICKKWYGAEEVFGVGDGTRHKETIATIERAEMLRAAQEAGAPTDKASLVFLARRCDQCQESEPMLILKRVANPNSKKPQANAVYQSMISQDDLKQLISGFPKS